MPEAAQKTIFSGLSNAGPLDRGPAMKLPEIKKKERNPLDVERIEIGIIPVFNSNDYNNYHDTEGFEPDAPGLLDTSAYTGQVSEGLYQKFLKHDIAGIPTKVMKNRYDHKQDLSFTGVGSIDYLGLSAEESNKYKRFLQDLSPSDLEEYSSFLGINFKKVGKAIGNAAKGVGHAVGEAGKAVGHAAAWTGKEVAQGVAGAGKGIAHAAVAAEKGTVKGVSAAGKGALKGVEAAGKGIGHAAVAVAKTEVRYWKWVGKEAVNYWPVIAGVAVGIVTANPMLGMAVFAAGEKLQNGSTSDSSLPAVYGGAGGADGAGYSDGSDIDSTTSEDYDPDDLQDTDGSNTADGSEDQPEQGITSPAPQNAGILNLIKPYATIASVIGALILAYFIFKHKK